MYKVEDGDEATVQAIAATLERLAPEALPKPPVGGHRANALASVRIWMMESMKPFLRGKCVLSILREVRGSESARASSTV